MVQPSHAHGNRHETMSGDRMNEGNPPRSLVYLAAAALVVATGIAMWLLPSGMPRVPPPDATGGTTAQTPRSSPLAPGGTSGPPATASAAASNPESNPESDPLSAPARTGGPAATATTTPADPDPAGGEAAGCPPRSPRSSARPSLTPPPHGRVPAGCHSLIQLRPTRNAAPRHLVEGHVPSG